MGRQQFNPDRIAGATEEAITLETGSADRLANMRAFALAGLELLKRPSQRWSR